MPNSNKSLMNVIGVAVATAAVSIGLSFSMSTAYTNAKITKAIGELNEQAPAMLDKILQDREAKALAEQRQHILANWAGAPDAIADGRHVYGNLKAEFTLVEFSDLECPFCKRFHDTPKRLADSSGGRLNWEWQHYPLQFHDPAAHVAATTAECVNELVGNKAFWAFTGEYFNHTQLNGQGPEDITRIAESVGVSPSALKTCVDSGKYAEKIQKQIAKGTSLGVTGTPATVVVDNKTGNRLLVKGAVPAQEFQAAIAQLIRMRDEPNQEQQQGQTQSPATVPAPIHPLALGGKDVQ